MRHVLREAVIRHGMEAAVEGSADTSPADA